MSLKIQKFGDLKNITPEFYVKIIENMAWNGGSCVSIGGNLNSHHRTLIKLQKINSLIGEEHELFCDLNVTEILEKVNNKLIY